MTGPFVVAVLDFLIGTSVLVVYVHNRHCCGFPVQTDMTSDDEVHRQLRVQGRRLPARTMDGLDEKMGCWVSDDGL